MSWDQSQEVTDQGRKSLTKGQRDQNVGRQWEPRPCGVSGSEGCPGAIKEAKVSREMSEGKFSTVTDTYGVVLVDYEQIYRLSQE